jgi:ferric-dicitrate binding protein FerR (iron transport regulator)
LSENFTHIDDDLLVKYLLEEASPEEQKSVEAWIAASENNQLYFEQLRTIWERSKTLRAVSTVNEDAAWQRFQQRVQKKERRPMGGLRIAASILIIAALGALAYYMVKDKPVLQLTARAIERTLIDTLSDGSVITLNKNASLTYPSKFKGKSRAVALKGEAFFNVTANKEKPFIITVNDVQVKVVGTSFNIKSTPDSIEVIVETGVVQVLKGDKMVELHPGEKTVILQRATTLSKQKEEEKLYNYYRTKEFVCDDTPLWKLVQVLNEAYNSNIVIEQQELRNLQLTTTFNNESLDHVLEVISATFNIKVDKQADKIILR